MSSGNKKATHRMTGGLIKAVSTLHDKCSGLLWKEHLPHATRIYQDANKLLRSIEHLAKLGHGHSELIVLHPVDASWNAFDQVRGIVILVVEEYIRLNT